MYAIRSYYACDHLLQRRVQPPLGIKVEQWPVGTGKLSLFAKQA